MKHPAKGHVSLAVVVHVSCVVVPDPPFNVWHVLNKTIVSLLVFSTCSSDVVSFLKKRVVSSTFPWHTDVLPPQSSCKKSATHPPIQTQYHQPSLQTQQGTTHGTKFHHQQQQPTPFLIHTSLISPRTIHTKCRHKPQLVFFFLHSSSIPQEKTTRDGWDQSVYYYYYWIFSKSSSHNWKGGEFYSICRKW